MTSIGGLEFSSSGVPISGNGRDSAVVSTAAANNVPDELVEIDLSFETEALCNSWMQVISSYDTIYYPMS